MYSSICAFVRVNGCMYVRVCMYVCLFIHLGCNSKLRDKKEKTKKVKSEEKMDRGRGRNLSLQPW